MATAIAAVDELARAQRALDRAYAALTRLEEKFDADPDNIVLKAEYALAKAEVDKAEAKLAWIEAGKPDPSKKYDMFVAASENVAAAQQEYTRARAAAAGVLGMCECE